jgi:hypothetical protein
MPPKRTPSPAARARRDLDALITAILDKLEADDPAWAAKLGPALAAARQRAASRNPR